MADVADIGHNLVQDILKQVPGERGWKLKLPPSRRWDLLAQIEKKVLRLLRGNDVDDKTKETILGTVTSPENLETQLESMIGVQSDYSGDGGIARDLQSLDNALFDWIQNSLTSLMDIIPSGQYAFLAIDEAMSMGKVKLTALRRILSPLGRPNLWVLLIDTNNRVIELRCRDPVTASTRVSSGSKMPSPFLGFPHDVFVRSQTYAWIYAHILRGWPIDSITHDTLLDFLPLMGRPLWNDYKFQLDLVWNKLMQGKQHFLNGFGRHTKMTEEIGLMLVTAVSSRVPLDLLGVQGTKSPEKTMLVHAYCT